jgi:hypothetical protein
MTRQSATQTQQQTPTTSLLSRGRYFAAEVWLAIGASNDPLEWEADRTAAEVMRMPDPAAQREPLSENGKQAVQTKPITISWVNGASLQQKCSECEQEQVQ